MKRISSLMVNALALLVLCALILFGASAAKAAAVPQAINYQAVLLDSQGDPITTPVNIVFTIYDAESGGNILWQETKLGVDPDDNGQFSLILGKTVPITESVLTGAARWLGIKVGTDAEITPRTELVSSAYSFRVSTVDQANAGTLYGPLTIEESQARAADARLQLTCGAKAPDTIQIDACSGVILRATNDYGEEVLSANISQLDQTAALSIRVDGSNQALYSATGTEYSQGVAKAWAKKVAVGAEGLWLFGASETEELLTMEEETPGLASAKWTDYSARVAGASVNIKAPSAALAEVFSVRNSSGDATFQLESDPSVGASMSFYSTAAKASTKGTEVNEKGYFAFGTTSSDTSVAISAGSITLTSEAKLGNYIKISPQGIHFINAAKGETLMTITPEGNIVGKGKIAMGRDMNNDGGSSNVLGYGNLADGESCSVTGGYNNSARGEACAVGAGSYNKAFGHRAFIGSGSNNIAGDSASSTPELELYNFVGAGNHNIATGMYSTIAGGSYNTAALGGGSIGGGAINYAYNFGTVSGGRADTASGAYSMVPGGEKNKAAGSYSFAAGRRAKTTYAGCFVWGDNTDADFASTATNQFLVRAGGGVGINVNNPSENLDVNGTARLRGIPSTATVYNTVMADGNGKLWKLSAKSSKRYKENIRELGVDPAKVFGLDPVRFSWKETGQEDIGLIAEDVEKLIPELVIYDEDGRPEGVKYDKVVFYLLATIKDLKGENDALRTQLKETDVKLSQLTDLVQTILAKQNDSNSGNGKMAINK